MKTLVTGGGGFIGSQVVKHLLGRGEKVRVLHLKGENLKNLEGCKVELVEGNVLDKAAVNNAVKGCSHIYHLAAIYALWMKQPQMMIDVNITGSRNVLDACVEHKVKKVVYTSSIARYVGQGVGSSATEDSPFMLGNSGELYSITKYQSQELAEEYATNGLNLTIVNPALPVGPGDIGPTPTGNYIVGIMKNPVLFYADTTTNIGDVRDIAYGHVLAMDKGQKGRSYILGGHGNIAMSELVALTLKILGKRKPVIPIHPKAFEAMGYAMEMYAEFVSRKAPLMTSQGARASAMGFGVDCSRAKAELGYHCRPLEESITDAIQWFKANGYA
jgi:dihydroflavonol-4-reductase